MLEFVNKLAEEVEKKYPEIRLQTFAYLYTEEPPKSDIKPRKNVYVRLCNTTSNQVTGAAGNKKFMERLKRWAGIAHTIYVWDYAIVFWEKVTGLPFPSEFSYPGVYKLYAENNVQGLFWEQEEVDIADMSDLKYYLHSKYMEKPFRKDFIFLFRDFMQKYYGPAEKYISAYRQVLLQCAKKSDVQISWFPHACDFRYIDPVSMKRIQDLFAKARSAVKGDKTLSLRVDRAAMGIARIAGYEFPWYYQKYVDTESARKRFVQTWKACKERGRIPKKQDQIISMLETALTAHKAVRKPEEFKGIKHLDFPGVLINCMT